MSISIFIGYTFLAVFIFSGIFFIIKELFSSKFTNEGAIK
jgi:hypothetical protein